MAFFGGGGRGGLQLRWVGPLGVGPGGGLGRTWKSRRAKKAQARGAWLRVGGRELRLAAARLRSGATIHTRLRRLCHRDS